MADQDGQVRLDDGAVHLHGVTEVREPEVDHAVGVLGVVVDHVVGGEPVEHLATEVVLELVPVVLSVQADRADQPRVLQPYAGRLELVEQQRQHHLAVRGVVGAALHPVGEGDRHGVAAADEVADRAGAERVGQRLPGGGHRIGQRRWLVLRVVGRDHPGVVGQIDVDVAVAVLHGESHQVPSEVEPYCVADQLYIRESRVTLTVRRVLLPLCGVALALGVWWLFSELDDRTPAPGTVLDTLVDGLTTSDGLLLDTRLSVLRVLIGIAIGCTLAVPVGFSLAWFSVVRGMFNPIVSFLRALPPLALIPLVIVQLGVGETARLSVLVYAAFFSAVVVIYESVAAIDDVYVRAARALGASELELFRRVVVPLTVPQIFVAVRVALGVCWATVVAAELVAAQRGSAGRCNGPRTSSRWTRSTPASS